MVSNAFTYNKTTTQDGRVTCRDGCALNNDTENENDGIDDDGIFSRDDFSEEPRVQGASPGSQFENGCQPALFCCI